MYLPGVTGRVGEHRLKQSKTSHGITQPPRNDPVLTATQRAGTQGKEKGIRHGEPRRKAVPLGAQNQYKAVI